MGEWSRENEKRGECESGVGLMSRVVSGRVEWGK